MGREDSKEVHGGISEDCVEKARHTYGIHKPFPFHCNHDYKESQGIFEAGIMSSYSLDAEEWEAERTIDE